jgi:ABC-type amino acid transport/signal transduction system, domain protein
MKMDRKYWLNTVIVCFLMMIIIFQIPMHVYADEKRTVAIGTNAEYAPFEYLDGNGDLTGVLVKPFGNTLFGNHGEWLKAI